MKIGISLTHFTAFALTFYIFSKVILLSYLKAGWDCQLSNDMLPTVCAHLRAEIFYCVRVLNVHPVRDFPQKHALVEDFRFLQLGTTSSRTFLKIDFVILFAIFACSSKFLSESNVTILHWTPTCMYVYMYVYYTDLSINCALSEKIILILRKTWTKGKVVTIFPYIFLTEKKLGLRLSVSLSKSN